MLDLAEVKEYLRLDDDNSEDGYLNVLILLSSEMCQNYMRAELPEECPESIRQACLIIIGHFYENRDGNAPIPQVVYRLLDPYRQEGF